ncbi:MAG: radical SAM protein [Desulfomonilaceae bacterium]
MMKLGLCEKCGTPTDARYEIKNNCVYLVKFCKDCGRTSSLVTKDARKWRWKREVAEYQEPSGPSDCSLNCKSCDHKLHTRPTTVAIDVTNLCNQRCPICLAYVDAMGFAYKPPLEYFEKIFHEFEDWDPRPNICFFGGEPTVHDDFLEIVRLAKSHGFQVQLFTNGLKLADMDYCKELCSLGVQVNFGLDGTKPEIYKTLRGDNSLAVKKRAFENVIKCGVNKLAVISTVASGVNDSNMGELMEFVHSYKEHVSVWAFVPLTPCWETSDVKLEPTTTECVENIFERILPDVEFVSTGMMKFEILSKFFGKQTLGGSHPNCESATIVISDGEKYIPLSSYLNIPLSEALSKLRKLDRKLIRKSPAKSAPKWRHWWFNLSAAVQAAFIVARTINLRKSLAKPAFVNGIKALVDIAKGRKIDELLSRRTSFKQLLTLITIPYEDEGGLENARLHDCPAVFAYEDVETGQIRTTAFCSWQTIKDDVCRKIQAHYYKDSDKYKKIAVGVS